MIEALLVAVRDTLRTALVANMPGGATKAKHYVDIIPGDSWPVMSGEWFASVDEESVTANSDEDRHDLEEVYSLSVTVTKKTGRFARDNPSDIYLENLRGLSALERKVIVAIHGNQTLRAAANTAAGGTPGAGVGDAIIEPLYFAGRGRSTVTVDPASDSDEPPTFMRRKLSFRGGRRIQALDVMK